jgi:pimeloyl-ACP methyl ester carboxylesterase
MLEQSVVYRPRNGYPFYITAKQYSLPEFDFDNADAVTLILLHGTGFHKETWEPLLETVFDLASCGEGTVKIREAWAIDCPNHGASAALNESILQQPAFRHNCM